MSALAQQLKKFEAPQTNVFKANKPKQSFIFDTKASNALSRDDIFDKGKLINDNLLFFRALKS